MRECGKTGELRRYLNSQLATRIYLPGSPIPSVRLLMKRFSLGYGTVRRVLQELCREGLLESVPRSGFVVSRGAPGNRNHGHRIGVLIPEHPFSREGVPGLVLATLDAIIKYAARFDYEIIEIPLDEFDEFNRFSETINCCDALIVLTELDAKHQKIDFEGPMSGMLLNNDFNGRISVIEIDPFNIAQQAIEYFRRNRVAKVTIFGNSLPVLRNRGKIFEYQWRYAGGEAVDRMIDTRFGMVENFPFQTGEGYFFTEDDQYRNYADDYALRTGGDLARDHCVLGVGGKGLMVPGFPSCPTIAVSYQQMGLTVFEEVILRLNNPLRGARRIFLCGVLKYPERQSQTTLRKTTQ